MKKSRICTFILTVAGLISLASCGGGDSTSNKITIPFWTTFNKETTEVLKRQCTAFSKIIKEKEGVDVEVVPDARGGYDEVEGFVTDSFTTGTTPTLAVAYPDNVATYLGKEHTPGEYVVDLNKFVNDPELGFAAEEELNPSKKGIDDFVSSFVEEGTKYIREGMYSLPYMKSTELMLYNKKVVEQVLSDMGIQTGVTKYMNELTWDQLITMLQYVNANRAKYGLTDADACPLYYDSDGNYFISQCFQRGIDYISYKDGKGSVDFVNDEAKAMVAEIKSLYDAGLILTKGSNKNQYSSAWFTAGKSIFVVGSTGGSGYSDPGVSFENGVCKFPVYKNVPAERAKYVSQGVTLTMLNNTGISKEENDLRCKYAWKFLKYITNEKNNINIALTSNGYIPVRESCYTNPDYAEYLAEKDYMSVCANTVVKEINGNYFNYPVFVGSDKARDAVEGIITNVLLNTYKKDTLEENIETSFSEAYKIASKAVNGTSN